MADFSTLIATIRTTIKTNYNQEITGQILQDDLLAIVDAVDRLKQDTLEGYAFFGEPLADGASVGATQNTFFLVGPGTYTINGVTNVITDMGITAIMYDSVNDDITTYPLFVYDTKPTAGSDNAITSGAVHDALQGVAAQAGIAEAVIDTDGAGTEQEFTFRKSGGDGGAYYRKIKGKTIAWNQLVPIAPSPVTVSENNVTITDNRDGSYTLNGTPTADTFCVIQSSTQFIAGHKYIFSSFGAMLVAPSGYTADFNSGTGVKITQCLQAETLNLWIYAENGVTYDNVRVWPQITDLTLASLDSITAADFLALYPGYHEYTPGTLISNDAEAVETTGVNQWDEEWETGGIGSGEPFPDNSQMRSKNYTPVIAGASLFCKTPNALFIFWYDANKNYINEYVQVGDSSIAVVPNGARYLKLTDRMRATYNHDICINISNPAINGQYFPYWKRTLQLGLTTRKDTDGNVPFADGMKGAGTAADWADKVGGEKRMGRVDLGSLSYSREATGVNGKYRFVANNLPDIKPAAGASILANIKCDKYTTISAADTYTPVTGIAVNPTQYYYGALVIYVEDFAAYSIEDFIAAMNGVMLDYELATPVPFTWKEPLNLGVKVDENGTERAVAPEGATAPSAPFVADTTYTMSVARMVEKLRNL